VTHPTLTQDAMDHVSTQLTRNGAHAGKTKDGKRKRLNGRAASLYGKRPVRIVVVFELG
jgi:hypothetical protein